MVSLKGKLRIVKGKKSQSRLRRSLFLFSLVTVFSFVLSATGYAGGQHGDRKIEPLIANAGPDKIINLGESTVLEGKASGGVGPYNYSWKPTASLDDPFIAQPKASPKKTTTYTFTVTDAQSRIAKDSVTITVQPAPLILGSPARDGQLKKGARCQTVAFVFFVDVLLIV